MTSAWADIRRDKATLTGGCKCHSTIAPTGSSQATRAFFPGDILLGRGQWKCRREPEWQPLAVVQPAC
jgi:hypothetical protein